MVEILERLLIGLLVFSSTLLVLLLIAFFVRFMSSDIVVTFLTIIAFLFGIYWIGALIKGD